MSTQRQEVAITFDDGPHPEYTPRILDALQEAKVHATFFVVGKNARRYPKLIRRIVDEDHRLGCHTETHVDLSRVGVRQAWQECRQSQMFLEQVSGQRIRILRPPWGRIQASTILIALCCKMRLAFWNVDSLDHRGITTQEMVLRLKNTNIKSGDILLFHDDCENTVLAQSQILEYVRSRDLAFSIL